MPANFRKFLDHQLLLPIYIISFKTILKTVCEASHNPMQWAKLVFFIVIYVKFQIDFPSPKPLKFNYSSKQFVSFAQTYRMCKAQITSVDFTYALKVKEAVFSAPLLPRKSNYNSDTVCDEGQQWRIAKSLENPERGNLLLWKRKASSPKGCRPHNHALNLTWYEQFSWCTISVHPRAQTPNRTAQRSCGGKARSIHWRRASPGKAGAPRRLKWMLFRWSTCAVALPVPGSAQRAELLSSESSSEAYKHGARTGLGEGARSSLAQSANYIIGTKERISLGLVWPSGALWRQLTDVETF